MEMIHTPPATGPTQSQLDDALGRVEELQGHLSQAEREYDSRIWELEARVAASDAAMARVQFEANSTRRVTPFPLEHLWLLLAFLLNYSDPGTVVSFTAAKRWSEPTDTGVGGTVTCGSNFVTS